MKLLIIDDDQNINNLLRLALKAIGYTVDLASDGEQGYLLAQEYNYNLIILDYNLPKLNGRDLIKKLRQEKINTPIIIISVRSELGDKTDLLELGADDYLTKPFALSELIARVRAITRRPSERQPNYIRLGNLELDCDRITATRDGRTIDLSIKEFALLEYLIRHKGVVLSRQEIMENVWDVNADPFSNTIEVHISNLRKKIENGKRELITTFSNRGYKLNETPIKRRF